MALKKWGKKFFSVPAKEAATDIRSALQHSLKKWTGLSKHNLKKYKLFHRLGVPVITSNKFNECWIDDHSCAMCQLYLAKNKCNECPIYKSNGNAPCGEDDTPYTKWVDTGKAKPMIKALKNALKKLD